MFEGIIGVGKSNATKYVVDYLNNIGIVTNGYYEPVENNPYLELFYGDMSRWGLEMQYALMSMRMIMHKEGRDDCWAGKSAVFDRSIFGDEAFAVMLHEDGFISKLGFSSYQNARQSMEKDMMNPHIVFYLDCPSDILMERKEKRNRKCEVGIGKKYLDRLDETYKKVVLPKLRARGIEVQMVDWSADLLDENGKLNIDKAMKPIIDEIMLRLICKL